ncbi:glutathione S-transferase family protein [Lacimicrobium alkaliphilum]|uniref:Glutathione S-transferase n=1 Tax=Lacimicrobium alkaliphilum TaxID=1526571 RepID=A0ABQ1RR19_9ALTE|nr:glutathione S-transferase family protein [Lacimicrobium alkaliphilum]GGD78685.1 glutathione S-transferase [Lacimicrobium alkaliphilum]
MPEIVLTTFDWVPEIPRGYVRDLRVRWALEEAGLPYCVESVSFRERDAAHFSSQPFGQVPWLTEGDITIFESGAMVLHVAEKSDILMPSEPHARSEVIKWLFAALNSVEAASLPWSIFKFSDDTTQTPGRQHLDNFLNTRLQHMEQVLAERAWLANDSFSVADILMADVLRLVDRFDGLKDYSACRNYIARATARPAFAKAYADQMEHFAAAD